MPRARQIKPGFFTNEDLVELPFEARLLFAGLWCVADRAGRLEDRPKRIKMEVFPADSVDVEALLSALNHRGFIHRYSSGSLGLIHVPSWPKHQHPHHREPESSLPACDCEAMGEPVIEGQPEASLGQTSGQPEDSPAEYGIRNTEYGVGAETPPPRTRPRVISEADILSWEGEHPTVDIRGMVADYLNWSGSSKHRDKVLGFQNQLRDQWRLEKFAKKAPERRYNREEGIFAGVD